MASRAVGALFGLAAAILFVVSIASPKVVASLPAWWDGHPSIEGKTYDRMDIHVGVLGAARCFDGGANCTSLQIDSTFEAIGYAELGVTGLAELLVILLVISIWRVGDRRKGLARVVLVVCMFAGAGTAMLVLLGPDVRATDQGRTLQIAVPIGTGLFMYWIALAASGTASLLALRVEPEPLRLKPSMAMQPVPTPDVREMLREQHDSLRPSALGPEPMIGAPPSPARGMPLFDAAPQLRPLYDVQGAAPVAPRVAVPERAPTPMPRASLRAIAGIDTPSPNVESARGLEHSAAPRSGSDAPDSGPIEPPPPALPPLRVPTMPDAPLRPKTQLPARPKPPSIPMPPLARPSQPKLPEKKSAPKLPEKKTIAHAVPPPPITEEMPAPMKLSARDIPRLKTDHDDRLETGMRETEAITAVEIDAEAKAAAVAQKRAVELAAKHAAELAQMTEGSNTSVEAMSSGSMGRAVVDISTAEERALAVDEGLLPGPKGDVGEQTDQVDSPPRPESRAETTNTDEARPTNLMPVPITTAPASLPPPKAAPAAMPSGPTPACPQCESPMAWVEEHLRFYCKMCRMYF
jgi:hypothetical protein